MFQQRKSTIGREAPAESWMLCKGPNLHQAADTSRGMLGENQGTAVCPGCKLFTGYYVFVSKET